MMLKLYRYDCANILNTTQTTLEMFIVYLGN